MQPAGDLRLPLPVDRTRSARPPALRPAEPAVRRRHHDHRRGRRGAVRGAPRAGLPGPRPLHDPHALPPGRGVEGVGSAGAVEPQAAGHPRRRLRRVVRPRRPAARRLLRHSRRRPGGDAELRHRARPRLRGAVDGARQHRPQLLGRDERRVGDDGQGAARRAVRRAALHDRHRLLRRLDRAAHGRERLPRHLPGPDHQLLLPGHVHGRRAVRRLPPAAALLRGPVALGAGRRVAADPDGAGRGPPLAPQRRRRRRGAVQVGAQPRGRRAPAPSTRSRATRRPATTPRPTRVASAARCSTSWSTCSARARSRSGPRRRRRPAAASAASRSPTPACSTASRRWSPARSRRPSSSTST